MSSSPRAGRLPRIGGALALDFCNTATGRGTDRHVEHLFDYEDLLRWSVFNEVLTPEAAAALAAGAAPAEQARAFALAMRRRAALSRAFDAVARRRTVEAEVLAEVGEAAGATWPGAGLAPAGAGYAWRFEAADARPDGMLGPILRSAVAVLTGADLSRLKACPGEDCGWLFLDATKNGGRVWCEMEVCGTRAKLKKRAAARRAAA